MQIEEGMRRNLTLALAAPVGMLVLIFLEAAALWRYSPPWAQARWTAAECAIISISFCFTGVISIIRIRKQVQSRSSE
jgi:hypothetical protein